MFAERGTKQAIEEGDGFAPKFDANGLIPAVAVDVESGAVLMLAYMNAEAIAQTLATGEVHYWSRSRNELWKKGETSGQVQSLLEMKVDCDQDALVLRVRVGGDGGCCHTGRPNCFYRSVEVGDGGDGYKLKPSD